MCFVCSLEETKRRRRQNHSRGNLLFFQGTYYRILSKKNIMEWDRSKINILFINSIPTNRGRSIGNRYKSREFFSCMICVDIFFSTPHDDFIFYFEFSMRYLQKDRTRLEELSCFRDHVDYNEKIPFERLILFLKKGSKKSFNTWKIRNFCHKKMFKIHFFGVKIEEICCKKKREKENKVKWPSPSSFPIFMPFSLSLNELSNE